MKDLLDRIHFPQALLLIATLASLVAFPILFLTLVPERLVDKVFGLPWMTIITLGVPALVVALAPLINAFMRPVVAHSEPDSKAPNVINVPVVVHESPPVESRDPDPTPRGPFRGGRARGGFAHVALLEVIVAAFLIWGVVLLSGCGAAPLQVASVGVTVSYAALGTVQDTLDEQLDARMTACGAPAPTAPADVLAAHEACLDAAHDRDAESVLDALNLAIDAIGRAVAVALEIDAGQELPASLISAFRHALALFDQVEAVLLRHELAVPPEIAMVVHTIGALIGGAAVDPVALRSVSRTLVAWRISIAAL